MSALSGMCFCHALTNPLSGYRSLRAMSCIAPLTPVFVFGFAHHYGYMESFQFSSVTQSCMTLCDPMDCSMPGLPVHHQLPELTQTHVHWVSDAIQPSHPLSSPSSPAFNLSQHQSFPKSQFFASGGQSIGAWASVLPMNIKDWFLLGLPWSRGSMFPSSLQIPTTPLRLTKLIL